MVGRKGIGIAIKINRDMLVQILTGADRCLLCCRLQACHHAMIWLQGELFSKYIAASALYIHC